jgi:hypothetical protein
MNVQQVTGSFPVHNYSHQASVRLKSQFQTHKRKPAERRNTKTGKSHRIHHRLTKNKCKRDQFFLILVVISQTLVSKLEYTVYNNKKGNPVKPAT